MGSLPLLFCALKASASQVFVPALLQTTTAATHPPVVGGKETSAQATGVHDRRRDIRFTESRIVLDFSWIFVS